MRDAGTEDVDAHCPAEGAAVQRPLVGNVDQSRAGVHDFKGGSRADLLPHGVRFVEQDEALQVENLVVLRGIGTGISRVGVLPGVESTVVTTRA